MSELEFYNRQYEKYGRYDHGSQKSRLLDLSNPEDYFEDLINRISFKDSTLVDLGCGDGLFTATLAPLNKCVIGVEPSDLIEAAHENEKIRGIENLSFVRESAEALSFLDSSMDIAISRRGPNPAREIARVLKVGGVFAFITIGEQDCRGLKEIIGRGQHFGYNSRVKDDLCDMFQAQGFEILECNDFLYTEHYESQEALVEFLRQVPIFDGFNGEDSDDVATYSKNYSDKKIPLSRHRVVLLARLGY